MIRCFLAWNRQSKFHPKHRSRGWARQEATSLWHIHRRLDEAAEDVDSWTKLVVDTVKCPVPPNRGEVGEPEREELEPELEEKELEEKELEEEDDSTMGSDKQKQCPEFPLWMVQDLAYMSGLEAESESKDEQTKEATLRQTKQAPDPEQMKQAPIPEQAMEAPDPEQTKETPTVEQTKEAQTKEAPTKEAPAISAAQRVMPEIKMKDGMPCYVTAEGGTIFGYVLADASADISG